MHERWSVGMTRSALREAADTRLANSTPRGGIPKDRADIDDQTAGTEDSLSPEVVQP